MKQIWSLGIQDKNLLCIISKILKSEIEGVGVPIKGTPQGGILSPLLSNIVLNELDWWLSSQWETFKTSHDYAERAKYRAMKTTNLKEMFMVRYADDFKIFCKDYKTAQTMLIATRKWLNDRLHLDISPEKSKVTNLRRNYTEFLGIKLMVKPKNKKFVVKSKMSDKALAKTVKGLKDQIKTIKWNTTEKEINKLNAMILGSHNYYSMATEIVIDFAKIDFLVQKTLYNKLKTRLGNKPVFSKTYNKLYGDYTGKKYTIKNITIFPVYGCTTKPPMNFEQKICNYTDEGRKLIHDKISKNYNHLIKYLLNNSSDSFSTEYCDNRISLMVGQKGKCYVTEELLEIGNMDCHHKTPKSKGGTDEYKNLVWLTTDVHKLIHATQSDTINKLILKLNLDDKGVKKVNSLRKLVGNSII